jgi:hypothetical protein
MRRRNFGLLGRAALAPAAHAQQGTRVSRIGYLGGTCFAGVGALLIPGLSPPSAAEEEEHGARW